MDKLRILLRLIKYASPYKWNVLLLLILGLIGVGFDVLKPLPLKYVIDTVLSNQPLPIALQKLFYYFSSVSGKISTLVFFVVASVLLVIGSSMLSLISTHLTTKVCQKMVYDLSTQMFDKLQRLSLSFYSKNNIGELLQRLSGDTYVIYSIIGKILLNTIFSFASILAMFYIMASINLTLALIAMSVVPAFVVLLIIFNKPVTDSITEEYDRAGKLYSYIQQALASIKIIQAYARENYTNKVFKHHNLEYNNASVSSTKLSLLYNNLVAMVSGIAGAIVIGIGAFKALNGTISTGDLFVFLGYIGTLFIPVNSLATTITAALTISTRARRVFDIMDSQEVVYEKPDAIEFTNIKGRVELRNLVFGYDSQRATATLTNFNLEVEAGKIVALVGPTGAGKTSLISLLLRFYDAWEGDILIDNVNIKDVKIESLRSNISLVLQDSFIFPMTIAENIAFGNTSATKEEIIKAAKTAQAHDFIMKLPNGYETVASEGGVSLSGGEKQRISLARAFLRNTPILILDEPTSALDVQTESKIFKALAEYTIGRTVFIISHRLSTIKHADLIVTIKDGAIAEKGTHESLVKEDKVYAELYKFQQVAI
jgi:ABC-type multidrug transport system fused ATPase/permease subunit